MRLLLVVLGAVLGVTGCLGHRTASSPARTAAPGTEPVAPAGTATSASVPVKNESPATLVVANMTPAAAREAFATNVQPMLALACAPCHNPGGKMYGRLPWDDPKVVREHEKGIRRRLKGDSLEAFERWLWLTSEGER